LFRFALAVASIVPLERLQDSLIRGRLAERFVIGLECLAVVRDQSDVGGVAENALLTVSGEKQLPVERVFLFTQNSRPIVDFAQGQIELTPEGCARVDREMATSAPGVFACGDLLCPGIQQAVVVAAQGCTAALAADKYLNRRDRNV
jgi:thioredoxin reductase